MRIILFLTHEHNFDRLLYFLSNRNKMIKHETIYYEIGLHQLFRKKLVLDA